MSGADLGGWGWIWWPPSDRAGLAGWAELGWLGRLGFMMGRIQRVEIFRAIAAAARQDVAPQPKSCMSDIYPDTPQN